jgi:hypothetical protein
MSEQLKVNAAIRCITLALEINRRTSFAVHSDFVGNVGALTIRIAKSDEEYNTHLAIGSVYLLSDPTIEGWDTQYATKLAQMETNLLELLQGRLDLSRLPEAPYMDMVEGTIVDLTQPPKEVIEDE